jgi:hypothetical protein
MITPDDVDTHVIMEQFVFSVQTQDYMILYDIDIIINFMRLPYDPKQRLDLDTMVSFCRHIH